MHPTADTTDVMYIDRLGRRVMPGVGRLQLVTKELARRPSAGVSRSYGRYHHPEVYHRCRPRGRLGLMGRGTAALGARPRGGGGNRGGRVGRPVPPGLYVVAQVFQVSLG